MMKKKATNVIEMEKKRTVNASTPSAESSQAADPAEIQQALKQALENIQAYYGKTVVIKLGGSTLTEPEAMTQFLQEVADLKAAGVFPVLVHGGGPAINQMLKKLNIDPTFVNGLRYTDEATMEVVEMVLSGKVNPDLVYRLNKLGAKAIGLNGKDCNLLRAQKKNSNGQDIGLVGEIIQVNTMLIESLINQGYLPVVSPVGVDEVGQSYNVNADYAAVAIAGALKAKKLVFVSDVSGVLKDKNDKESVIPRLSVKDVPDLVAQNVISDGMVPKVDCCVTAVHQGVESVFITDGKKEHGLLLDLFEEDGDGTRVEA
ncbi:MAG: acetylglutamate kinase [Vampirovibrio sp.]|nr:acetylglutamate kinase [Vampirovibrio sp.]